METNIQETKHVRRERTGVKLLIISALCVLLLIPWIIIRGVISERSGTRIRAEEEVAAKWGEKQRLTGPVIKVYGPRSDTSYNLLPDVLDIEATVDTRSLSRGIYDFVVYDAGVTMHAEFRLPPTLSPQRRGLLAQNRWNMAIELSTLKGLTDNPQISIGGRPVDRQAVTFEDHRLLWHVDVGPLLAEGGKLVCDIVLPLRGAEALQFDPVGNTTSVRVHSDCTTPSFAGNFLPMERTVTAEGFDAEWRVLAINRNFAQVVPRSDWSSVHGSYFEVQLRQPVEQYQQSERAVKYAYLIVLLTFAVVFFVEVRRERPIHPVQYLLVGIAIMLFYTLLLSFSEHLSFALAYVVASVMTVVLVGFYVGSIMRSARVGGIIGGLLAVLYLFIYILLQIESYALLVGSVGLFVVLAVAMAATRRVDWYRGE